MASKCCSKCAHTLPLSSFLADPSNPGSKIRITCIKCRSQERARLKRKALEPLDPNVPSKRPTISRAKPTEAPSIPPPHVQSETRPECPLPPQESRPQAPLLIPPPVSKSPPLPPPQPAQPPPPVSKSPPQPAPPPIQPVGFLLADQWKLIQDFHTALDGVKMEYCLCWREQWFSMGLRDEICDACFLRDKGSQSPFLMSMDNEMDLGDIPAHLPALTQVEEMIIACSHVQMLVHQYWGHQYHYSGHCVSFMQNNVKTVNMLPNLPSELDIVVLLPSNQL